MFKLVLACALVASAFAGVFEIIPNQRPSALPRSPYALQPQQNSAQQQIPILRQSQDIQPDGSYQYEYETANGIAAQESAQIRALGPDQAAKSAQGSFSWTSPEGEQISVSYLADENGYQPQGSHLPVAPPIPAAIQRALKWIAEHPEPANQQSRY